MKLLALDTSSLACSVALSVDGPVLARHEEQAREHTRLLMPMIRGLLEEAGTTLQALDGIVLGNGPGSFIGMRIAASVAQGLAHGAGLRILPVSSLAAVALRAGEPGDLVAVAQDAHMNEVYLGIYERLSSDDVRAVGSEQLQAQAPIAGLRQCVAAGFGWQRYPALLEQNRAVVKRVSEVLYPDARDLLRLAEPRFARGAIAPEDVQPAYLRQKVAEKPGRGDRNASVT
ncbi:MAG: tRNA (adenosine(37)-N6)-threonylcarbamoyltransferase complex dimerization subunit type 1 TsaB [Woeseiaceae bacterium]|nr:tRNA (adenosine(37)-N6)-threonylcarbamoyltransferase complex dimerization subunit type 1 TsaB [Woeseiaceae bacterium]